VIDIKLLRQDPEGVRKALARRLDPALDRSVAELLELDRRRREAVTRAEQLKAERNTQTAEVARRKGKGQPTEELLAQLKTSAEEVKRLEVEARDADTALDQLLLTVPNPPFPSPQVPDGDASGNREVKRWGELPRFTFTPKPHWELGQALGLFDLSRGAKLSGSGFPLFTGAGARLVRALQGFMLDLHTREHGYLELAPPLLVSRETMTGTGQLPKFEEDLYRATEDDLFLIPTAEVPVTNFYRDEILDGGSLPIGLTAFTACFRREAGAHGKDTRGLIRVHQFDKVELVRFCRPDDGPAEHERLTRHAETVLERLEIPYRRVALAAGDLGFASACTFDLEVWAAGVGAWLEASSASIFTDFQARRANIRFRREPGARPEFVYTLNASGVAFPRTIIALLENNQEADGSVRLPPALVPHFGADRLTSRA
jgi:seryl-tRNA synthetase